MSQDMAFGNSIKRTPVVLDRPAIEGLDAADCGAYREYWALLQSGAACSPFLKGSIEAERDWVLDLASRDPAAVMDSLCAPPDTASSAETATLLRQRKRRVSLLVALADLGGLWPLETVTAALTRFADLACNALLRPLIAEAVARNRLTLADPGERCGLFALAMGKMGAHELNYSSDIDLIVLFDETLFETDATDDAKSQYIRITRTFSQLMNATTRDGYIFRLDLRLRPDPLINPVCLSAGGAMRYYESFARTWERAAFIKARPCAGDRIAADRFLRTIDPFIWRTLLDYAAVHDTAEIRGKISDEKGTGDLADLHGHDLKLGQGGIRQIELYVQTFQMLAGGRDGSLRLPGTVPALRALCAAGWITADVRDRLTECYRILRNTEHRLQMIQDTQTHSLPRQPDDMPRIAALCGHDSADAFLAGLTDVLVDVDRITSDEKAEGNAPPATATRTDFLTEPDREMIKSWRSLPALRTDRAVELFMRLEPMILTRMGLASNPHNALVHFDRFLRGLPAGVQLFSLFDANPKLVELLTDICTTAPRLAEHLGRTSHVFDDVLYRPFFQPFEETAVLQANLDSELDGLEDYEATLRTARRWLNAQKFRLGVHHLKHMIGHQDVSRNHSRLADAVLRSLWPRVVDEFARRHGAPPGRGASVLAMGSLGAQSMTAASDLDLIVIYDPLDITASTGPKSLPARQYFARLTQAFVAAITAPLGEGILYEIDLRLRPSGRKGPVATSLDSFRHYQQHEAWTWEHLALTRARVVCGSEDIGDEIEAIRTTILANPHDRDQVLDDVRAMRGKLSDHLTHAQDRDDWELRKGQGRMLDIELLAQSGALLTGSASRQPAHQLNDAADAGWLPAASRDRLVQGYDTLSCLHQAMRLTLNGSAGPIGSGEGVEAFLLQQTGQNSLESLISSLQTEREAMTVIIDRQLA